MNSSRSWAGQVTLLGAIGLAAWIAVRLLLPSLGIFVILIPPILALPAVFLTSIPWSKPPRLPWWLVSIVPALVVELYAITSFGWLGIVADAFMTMWLVLPALFGGKVADTMVKRVVLDWQEAEHAQRTGEDASNAP